MVSLTHKLKQQARDWGADLVGVADLGRLHGIQSEPHDLLADYSHAVSLAVHLSDGVIGTIKDKPTPLYSQHYMRVNTFLDDLALKVTGLLQAWGGAALPIPASQVLDYTELVSYLSHKAVAVAAGLGWQGKSLLTVTKEWGPRIRLVTVLTNLGLEADAPMKNLCGSCTACTDACPARAIKNVNTDSHYAAREDAVDIHACAATIKKFGDMEHVTPYICGVCIAVCPWGRPKQPGKEAA